MTFPTIPTAAGNRVAGLNQLNLTATLTGPNLNTLTGRAAGDLIIAIAGEYQSSAGTDAAFTGWAGGGLTWTEIRDSTGTTNIRLGVAFARLVTGSETGAVTVTRSGTLVGDASMILLCIPGASATINPEATVMATGNPADPASLSPSWGAADTLWVGANGNGMTSGTGSWTANNGAPTNYSDFFGTNPSDTSTIGDFGLAVAFRQLNAASEDMGTFSQDTTNARSGALVIAVPPEFNQSLTLSESAGLSGGGGAPTLITSYFVETSSGATLQTPSFTPSDGEVIVVKAQSNHGSGGTLFSAPSGGSLTYTERQQDKEDAGVRTGVSHDKIALWTAEVGVSPGSMTVSLTCPADTSLASFVVERWTGKLDATPVSTAAYYSSAGTPSVSLTTEADSSIVSWISTDWNAISTSTRAYITSSATPTEEQVHDDGGANFSGYWAYQDAPTAGSQTFGLTAPGGQAWGIMGIEVQGEAAVSSDVLSVDTGGGSTPKTLSESAAVTEQLLISVTRSESATATEKLTIALSPSDSASATDTARIAVLLIETAAASEVLTTTATTTVSDVAAANDKLVVSVFLTESAEADEALQVAVPVAMAEFAEADEAMLIATLLLESASASESLSLSRTIFDSGVATDILVISLTLSDVGAMSEQLQVSVPAVMAEAATATESMAIGVLLAESASVNEQLSVNKPVTLSESATATEQMAVAFTITDSGAATDVLQVSVPVTMTDISTATDVVAANATVPLGDNGSATDVIGASAALTLAELPTVVDTLTLPSQIFTISDSGAATDRLGVGVSRSESGACTDKLLVTVAVPLGDLAAAAEATSLAALLALADLGQVVDTVPSAAPLVYATSESLVEKQAIGTVQVQRDVPSTVEQAAGGHGEEQEG